MKELWKDIEGYEGLYQVSNLGSVRNAKTGRVLTTERSNCGYLRVGLCKNKRQKKYSVHRLVAIAFIPNPHNLPIVNHIDENKENNCVLNLEWCSANYNTNYGTSLKRRASKRRNGVESKPIMQFDLQGNLIGEYPSIREAQRQLNYSNSNIVSVCKGRYKQAYGYIWRYKEKETA